MPQTSGRTPPSKVMTGLFCDRDSVQQAYETSRAGGDTAAGISMPSGTDETRKSVFPADHADTTSVERPGRRRGREPASAGPSAPPWVP